MNEEELRSQLNMPEDVGTDVPFVDSGIDSWKLVELRAVLETRHGIRLSDEDWLELETPEDVLRLLK